ncbi:DMT family transporter [Sulfuracidifex tepidarius]|uniref:Transporter in sor 3'region n=1 Tax=Sulfuracidifex tepidarius TaxID=1294262 RepID=A0A510DYD6_9CREN|nr:DMT family transporter [Sulfuracidifex tepidarius]BBG25199.1 putative transporter in sor 3'region [Sulfuracidifex tepidarius]BBG27992.1 putative transporter in sor 3'region [Sulfuracidifex tepidarius]
MNIAKYLIPYIIFSTLAFYFAKDGVEHSSPVFFMGIRYVIAGLPLLLFVRKMVINKDTVVLALLTSISSVLWGYGLVYVSPSESAVLSYSMPIFSLPIALLLIKEIPQKEEIVGLAVASLGLGIYSIPLMRGFQLEGAVLTLANAFFWASYTVYYRKMKDMDPMVVNTSQLLIGGLMILVVSPLFGTQIAFTVNEVGDLLFVSTFGGSVTFLLWNMMMKYEKVNKVTVASYSIPIFTTVLQSLTSYSLPSSYSVSGLTLMTLGIGVSRLKGGIGKVKPKKRLGQVHRPT